MKVRLIQDIARYDIGELRRYNIEAKQFLGWREIGYVYALSVEAAWAQANEKLRAGKFRTSTKVVMEGTFNG